MSDRQISATTKHLEKVLLVISSQASPQTGNWHRTHLINESLCLEGALEMVLGLDHYAWRFQDSPEYTELLTAANSLHNLKSALHLHNDACYDKAQVTDIVDLAIRNSHQNDNT